MRVTGSTKRSKRPRPPFIVGVAGGSGSGKTYFARALADRLGPETCTIVYQDNFYIDQSSRFDHDGGSVNFDHPDSLDFPLLEKQLGDLKEGRAIDVPVYDFATHKRLRQTLPVPPLPVILVDGILIFHPPGVRRHFDDLIFFDAPEDLRFRRRLERDVAERGRTPEGVRAQYDKQVKPMHDQFVEPSKAYARTVVRDVGDFAGVLDDYARRLLAYSRS